MKIIDIPRSGSFADKTSSRNRGGQYVRNRRAPSQPLGTGRRALVRGNFSAASNAWSALSDQQRAGWIAFAASYPYIDSLGQTIFLTGHQLFVSANSQLLNCGQPINTAAPLSATQDAISNITIDVNGEPEFIVTHVGGSAGRYLIIQTAAAVSPGRSRPAAWWQAIVTPANTLSVDIQDQYAPEFGSFMDGMRYFVRVTPVNEYGLTGASQIVTGLAVT